MKVLKSAAVVAASGALALGLAATPAFASTYIKNAVEVSGAPPSSAPCSPVYVDGGTLIGKACFESYGDKFWLRDMRADGAHVEVRAMYAGNPQTMFFCKNYKGAAAGWTRCSFHNEMVEDRTINFAALVLDGNTLIKTGWTVSGQS